MESLGSPFLQRILKEHALWALQYNEDLTLPVWIGATQYISHEAHVAFEV